MSLCMHPLSLISLAYEEEQRRKENSMSFRSPYVDLYELNEDYRNQIEQIKKECRKELILKQIKTLKIELKGLEEDE